MILQTGQEAQFEEEGRRFKSIPEDSRACELCELVAVENGLHFFCNFLIMAYFMKYLRQFDKQIGAFKLAVSISVLGKDFKLGYLFLFSPFTGVMFYA